MRNLHHVQTDIGRPGLKIRVPSTLTKHVVDPYATSSQEIRKQKMGVAMGVHK